MQYGPGNVRMSGRSLSAFLQDDWRKSGTLTFNLGVRYELIRPFYEDGGQMVNLDVAPDFTAAVPVLSGETGPFTATVSRRRCSTPTRTTSRRASAWPGG